MPGHLIRRLLQQSNAVFQDWLKAAGIDLTSVQYAALATLARHPGIDQATLAGRIAYDRATIGGVVQRLERKGLVTRRVDTQDRRARSLTLTRQGEALLTALTPLGRDLQADIHAALTPQERRRFVALVQKAVSG
ncbi:MarR family transcriptional regulator [Aestuariicoccus sp. MJ-SS9]|uniref:MarR family winged helix-turn-helix transcriptional regulator n=1 Tax=Aestuariicoccus sp. MJ-SS9 TaxID=3079855 RepID=UPI00290D5EC4|nr:MarR family transcriptional regulator [Aestuariicoccus sp. MJ-SS9]MDU8911934.1 MarR family transcriptional regulator [Aestuariicoccus sp. MJ-SS9]